MTRSSCAATNNDTNDENEDYYDVKPFGMLFFLFDSPAEKRKYLHSRRESLGEFFSSFLDDRVLMNVLEHIDDAKTLAKFTMASKMCFQYASFDSLWKKLYLNRFGLEEADFRRCRNWKQLYYVKANETTLTMKKKTKVKKKMGCVYSDALYLPKQINNLEIKKTWVESFTVPEIDCSSSEKRTLADEKSIESRFREEFENKNRPVVLRGLAKEWRAIEKWKTNDALLNEYGDETFLVGGYRTSLNNYLSYCLRENDTDDSKLLLFDPKVAKEEMWTENTEIFEEGGLFHNLFSKDGDYFKVLGEEKRPHYKWVIFGPNRSGSTFHVDPNGTSAWNAVLRGRKKWILFPNDEVPPGVFPSEDNASVVCPLTPLEWYENFYDTLLSCGDDDFEGEETSKRAYHFQETICEAGDVIFVPSQWWHCVVNLPPEHDDQDQDEEDRNVHLALTANFVSRSNMPTVLKILDSKNSNLVSGYDDKTQRRSLGEAFEKRMREIYPEILEDARKQRARTTKKEIAPPRKQQKRVGRLAKTTENANNVTKKPRGENANENNTKNKISTATTIFSQHQQEQHTSSFAFSFWAKEEETNDTTTQAKTTKNTNTF